MMGYFCLRLINSALAMLWGFLLTAVMIRTLGIDEFGRFVIAAALGVYLQASDFGISSYVYAKLRHAHLQADLTPYLQPIGAGLTLYLLIAATACILFGVIGPFAISPGKTGFLSLLLFFACSAIALPWGFIRALCNATDQYIFFEAVDAVRRISHVAIMLTLLLGVSVLWMCVILNMTWAIAFAAVYFRIKPVFRISAYRLWALEKSGIQAFWDVFGHAVRPSMIFSISEMFLYNLGYIFIPFAYGTASALVVYDLFNKFLRAGISGNQVTSTALLPQLTKAYHSANRSGVIRNLGTVLGLSLLLMSVITAGLLVGGHEAFAFLLHKSANLMTPEVLLAIIIALYANAIQNSGGSLIINLGLVRLGQYLALTMLGAVIAASVIVYLLSASVDSFVLVFSVVYLMGSCLWGALALRVALYGASEGGSKFGEALLRHFGRHQATARAEGNENDRTLH